MKKISIVVLFVTNQIFGQNIQIKDFQNPPNAAKPRVWWHWMNGNITKEGIKKDLEWFEKTGIGGFQNFDANLLTPVVVPNKLVFMTPEWKDAFKYTTQLAKQKGLEMAIAGSPGWSVTGGPWVKPEDGMKKFVWTETHLEGGKAVKIQLPTPSNTAGKFQSGPIRNETFFYKYVGETPKYYHDAKVVAVKLPSAEVSFANLTPKVSSSGGSFDFKNLSDGDVANATILPPMAVGEDMWIQYEFNEPQTFKAVSLGGASNRGANDFSGVALNRTLKVSDDGISFKEVTKFTGSNLPLNSISFEPIKAKFWRVTFKTLPPPFNFMAAMTGGNPSSKNSDGVEVSEFVLHATERIDQAEDKAGFTPWREDNVSFMPLGNDAISTENVVDITNKMDTNGILNWEAPSGNWTILRFGYSLTGRQNHPASPEATGLEVDKLDKNAVKKYINTYLDMYKDATGNQLGTKGLEYMVLDSYEAGHMNWTKKMPEEFKRRRGYDLLTWLPVLTGRIVKNVEDSEKFLWDFRKTIGEMITEYHYETIGEELHKRGIKRYTESHEYLRIFLADGMDVKRKADIPMAAMWTPGSQVAGANEEVRSEADIRESASVANIYGKPIVAAESMTAIQNAFSWHPEKLKRTADMELASGLNRYIIHTSVHQPLDDKTPGFTLGPFGQYFTRHETWAGAGAKAWMDYLGRSSYMMQQGKNVADVLYYYGENTNITWVCREKLPQIPAGFEFDFVNSTALINAISAKNGKLVAQSGNTYKVLVLDESAKWMTLPLLKKIQTLVANGVKVIGNKPIKSPSLSDSDAEFQQIANEIWGNKNVHLVETLHATSLQSIIGIQPDVTITETKNKILFRHRKTALEDIYWLNNRSNESTSAEVSFNITGKIPVIWHPLTGSTKQVSYKIQNDRTSVSLNFDSWDAYFIVFQDNSKTNSVTLPMVSESTIATITTPWQVTFGSKNITMEKPYSWTESTDDDIKYFSGTATYKNKVELPTINQKQQYMIEFENVKNVAEIIVNGINVGTIWKKPYKLDLSKALKSGENIIQVNLTNLWVNRLIGDAQPNVKEKSTFTTIPFYQAKSPLQPSGLWGDVKIIEVK